MDTSIKEHVSDALQLSRRRLGLLGMAALGGLALGECASAAAAGVDDLVVAYGAIGANRHPWQAVITVDFDILNLIFDPLLTSNADGGIVPSLAETWERTSPTVIRLKLREGAAFHDGRRVTAEDVKYSIELAHDPRAILGFYYRSWLDRVEIVDDRTVEIVAKTPSRLAPQIIAFISFIMPTGARLENYTAPIGSGPYRFVEFVPNNRLKLERNPTWWGPPPRFRTITIRQIPEPSTRIAALASAEVDYAENIPVEDIATVEASRKKIISAPTTRLLYVGFNRTGATPVQDKLVRQAVNHAIDKEGIRAALFNGLGAPAESIIPAGFKYRSAKLARYDYDPDKAKALLAQAGYPNGFEATFAGPNNRYIRDRETCEAIVSQLEAVGIRAKLRLFDWSTYVAELRADRDAHTGKYAMWLWGWGSFPTDAESSFGSLLTGSAYNMAGFANPRLMDLLARSRAATDDAALTDIFAELEKLVWEDEAQMAGLLYLPQIVGISPRLAGMTLRLDESTRWATL
ncbi:ABC-type transport system substrate-binding protein [Rhodoblastus acidophilus]|uniref:ABC transporter substrate-binding protein n=1 Tax=Rhodoblastus acidophilus TaxID=1074 RepID=UPI0022252BDD|nr:ABC transporter substrate-binding protein [Rhodoblastus acidophilus]MCW2318669.1 ABC-type transport system substrate-binding protein [Rhodoblastus acidophilus]